jgi:hypothetical protein
MSRKIETGLNADWESEHFRLNIQTLENLSTKKNIFNIVQ